MAHVEKEYMLKEVADYFRNSSGLIVTNFEKLKVVDINALRRKLEKKSIHLIVTKNTLLKKALSEVKCEQAAQFIDGITGIAVCKDDPVAAAKALFDFSKDHETFKVRGGIVDGQVIDATKAKVLSELPGKDVLRTIVLMRMKSPIVGLVNVLSCPVRGLVAALNQISQKKR